MKLRAIFRTAKRWFSDTPDRSLEQAYRAALTIKALEDEYFEGQKTPLDSPQYGNRVISYCNTEIKKNLKLVKVRLAEFKTSSSFINLGDINHDDLADYYGENDEEIREKAAVFIEKLKFIDEVISKYEKKKESVSLVKVDDAENPPDKSLNKSLIKKEANGSGQNKQLSLTNPSKNIIQERGEEVEKASNKTGVLPRSILRTIRRIRREIDPQSRETEEEVINKFRRSRDKTAISIKFLLLLIIVPLLTHQITKTFVLSPLIKTNFFPENSEIIFVNEDMQEEAFAELRHYEENLHFKSLIGLEISTEEIEDRVKERAKEIAEEYRHQGTDVIGNVIGDIFSLIAFTWIILVSKREIAILKSFLDEIIYGLSDSAKAFLIILFTDMFVGFHSPHGWEVILEGIARHFGLPESRDFNFLFIATFPVILDTVLKYWIFRYLNRISPSSVATYRNMNE